MKVVYWQRGETLDYKNETDAGIEAGEVVMLGARIGVAGTPIPIGGIGAVSVEGVYKMPKKEGEAIPLGAQVYYTVDGITALVPSGNGAVTGSSEAGESVTAEASEATVVGYAVETSAADQVFILVKLQG